MNEASPNEVTRLLQNWSSGDEAAPARLMELVYGELRLLARSYLRGERPDHTLQPTALVHEAYLRLVDGSSIDWQNSAHFYGIAARVMRRVLVDHAQARNAAKRGGGMARVELDAVDLAAPGNGVDLVELDEALKSFAEHYPRKSEVVELKLFGGLEAKEIAEVLGVAEKTVLRDWGFAKLWLRRRLDPEGSVPP